MLWRFIQPENAPRPPHGQVRPTALKGRRIPYSALWVTALLVLSGCGPATVGDQLNLPVTPVISVRPRWAVATETYVRVSEVPANDTVISGHLRLGDVAEVTSISTRLYGSGGALSRWYEISSDGLVGWASGSSFEFFESESRARNAARMLGVSSDSESSEERRQDSQ